VRALFGSEATSVEQDAEGVTIGIAGTGAANAGQLRARYVVGCDGPKSMVRKAIGATYAGQHAERREFFGGNMLTLYIRSPGLYDVLGKDLAWQYWAVNPVRRGLMVAVNGADTFALLIQLAEGEVLDNDQQRAHIEAVVGARLEFDIIGASPWTAGHALVAERFRDRRLLIAGDAAHLFTPTGGMGYNTSIDDAVNLGWKLAAVVRGWAPPSLLETYESERRPIALRNTAFARSMADSIGRIAVPPEVAIEGAAGDAARARLGEALAQHVFNEFNIPGLQLGLSYAGSPIVAREAGEAPPDLPNHYVPTGYPGARAPHVAVGEASLLDYFGRGFTLLNLARADLRSWEAAARNLEIPLTIAEWQDDAARSLYGADLILIRPDHHVAWRGCGADDAALVFATATGRMLDH
jgi:hypothetical protein